MVICDIFSYLDVCQQALHEAVRAARGSCCLAELEHQVIPAALSGCTVQVEELRDRPGCASFDEPPTAMVGAKTVGELVTAQVSPEEFWKKYIAQREPVSANMDGRCQVRAAQ